MKYADNVFQENGTEKFNLSDMREDIGMFKGIGEKCFDEIMRIIKGYLK